MSEPGLAAVLLMVFTVMVVTSYWRQIAIFLFYLALTVFCFGVYYVVSLIAHIA
jgi:uncharacterized membrane protein